MAEPPPTTAVSSASTVNWEAVQDSPDFRKLRHALRSFVFPVTVAFLVWYFSYVLRAAFARDFMDTKVFGNINIGLLFRPAAVRHHLPDRPALRPAHEQQVRPEADQLRDEIEGVV